MAIPWGAIISAAGSIGGGLLGSRGAKDAANAQAAASAQQLGLTRDIYNSQMALNEPFRATGQGANNLLAQLYGLPYYDYQPASPISGYGYGGLPGSQSRDQNRVPGYASNNSLFTKVTGLRTPLNALFGSKPWIYRQNDAGMIEFNGKNSGRDQLGGYINPQTGEVVLSHDPYGNSAELLTNYLRTGKGELPGYASRFGQAVDALRGAGWTYNQMPTTGEGGGFHPGGSPDLSVFQTSPGYQFRMNEGMRGIEQSAAARSGVLNGNALRSLTDFNQNLASNDFYNFVNQMNNMAGRGQTAVMGQQNAGTNFANMGGQAIQNAGAARASGIANSANMWGQAIGGVADAVGGYFAGQQQPSLSASAYGGGLPNISSYRGWQFNPNASWPMWNSP